MFTANIDNVVLIVYNITEYDYRISFCYHLFRDVIYLCNQSGTLEGEGVLALKTKINISKLLANSEIPQHDVCSRIRFIREFLRISQEKLAEEIGVSRKTICKYETEEPKRGFNRIMLQKIVDAFVKYEIEISINDLLGFEVLT